MKAYLVTLGCPKNEADSAGMATLLRQAGYTLVERPAGADVLIVNTCGFIGPAREESLRVIRELAARKRPGQRLVAAGCMVPLHGEALRAIPGVDALLGVERLSAIAEFLAQQGYGPPALSPALPFPGAGLSAVHGASAYLKIADGCDARCAFCTIPRIKGPYRSAPRDLLVAEARALVARGVQEIVLVAQDTTAYGRDLGEKDGLPGLIEALLEAVPELPWLRIMYTYPQHITPRLIEVMARFPQVCPYLDIPLQHAHPATLARMGRPADIQRVRALLRSMRERIPDLVLRTTFIVGYPGETEEEFAALRDFVQEQAFERVGVFVYSKEEGTPAAELPDPVPEEVAFARREELMALQQGTARRWGERQVGRTIPVLIEGIDRKAHLVVGRSRWDAPEVDGLVLAQGDAQVGTIVPVRITAASAYDLWGTVEAGGPLRPGRRSNPG
ncbi:MAG: 30S ribosomal protein S12 methylthiotransferase RimO [Chloroflexia bacterium]